MSRGIQNTPDIIELHFENKDGRVRIIAPDNHVIISSVEAAVDACRAYASQLLFRDQFNSLIEKLAQWLEARTELIQDSYLTIRDSGLLFLVVTKNSHFDDTIESSLTDLDLEVSQDSDFDLISLSVHAIPRANQDTVRSFVSNKMALRLVPNVNRS